MYFPAGYEFKTGYQAVVFVAGTVTEEGKVIDIAINAPLNPAFDKITMAALADSLKWVPAISHNRKVYDFVSLAVNFSRRYY